jgi:hypothetical protein
VTGRVMNINLEGWRERGPFKKRWMDSLRKDMRQMEVSDKMTNYRGEWKEKTCYVDYKSIGTKAGRKRIRALVEYQ